jgi:thioredoxin 1
MICCGHLGPMCIPVCGIMEEIEDQYTQLKFADMEFEYPQSHIIRNVHEVRNLSVFLSRCFVKMVSC